MTARLAKVVFDTNVLVSAVLRQYSNPAIALRLSLARDEVLTSKQYRDECYEVFQREKFDRYASLLGRLAFLHSFFLLATPIAIRETVSDCVDPKDNMILELALSGRRTSSSPGTIICCASLPWRGVRIVTPSMFLQE